MNNEKTSGEQPIFCFGETLWDVFPGKKMPGGAPMNVAYHLNKLSQPAFVISKVGNDADGRELLNFLKEQQVPTVYIQHTNAYPTGRVTAMPQSNGDTKYRFQTPSAWDFIDIPLDWNDMSKNDITIIFGTLASRNAHSSQTLKELLTFAKEKIFDINLREPYYEKDLVAYLLQQCTILKLNEDELYMVANWFSITGSDKEMMAGIARSFTIPDILLTRGANGAVYFTDNRFFEHSGYKVNVVDTVGAGDACLAGFLAKKRNGCKPDSILNFACKLGSYVASQNGACPNYDTSIF